MSVVPGIGEEERAGGEPESDASALCVSCGLCCTGAIFTDVGLGPEEAARLRGLGGPVEQVGERLQLVFPCPHHSSGSCGIYSDRYLNCRKFRCALLKRLDAGEVTVGEAQATVAQALKMLARVTEIDPAAAKYSVRRANRAVAPGGGEGVDRGRLLIESLALDLFFDRKFRTRKSIGMDETRRAGGEER
jgi:hypothetical protein